MLVSEYIYNIREKQRVRVRGISVHMYFRTYKGCSSPALILRLNSTCLEFYKMNNRRKCSCSVISCCIRSFDTTVVVMVAVAVVVAVSVAVVVVVFVVVVVAIVVVIIIVILIGIGIVVQGVQSVQVLQIVKVVVMLSCFRIVVLSCCRFRCRCFRCRCFRCRSSVWWQVSDVV